MPRFAANLSMTFTELDFLERFAVARRQGFAAVEYLFPYAYPKMDLAGRLEGEGLQQVLFNAPPGDWEQGERGIAGLPGREAEFRKSLEIALDYAAALKCPRLHVMAGLVPAGKEPRAYRETFLRNLTWAAPLAAAAGVQLLLEPLNPVDFPGYLVGSVASACDIIAASRCDNIFLQYDLYHAQMSQGGLAQAFSDHFDRIRHVQIAGVPGRHEPDAEQEINYPFLFSLMDELGYKGWVGCECRPRAGTIDGLAWAAPWGIGPKSRGDNEERTGN
jgi:hydroxypyruvate isomerase